MGEAPAGGRLRGSRISLIRRQAIAGSAPAPSRSTPAQACAPPPPGPTSALPRIPTTLHHPYRVRPLPNPVSRRPCRPSSSTPTRFQEAARRRIPSGAADGRERRAARADTRHAPPNRPGSRVHGTHAAKAGGRFHAIDGEDRRRPQASRPPQRPGAHHRRSKIRERMRRRPAPSSAPAPPPARVIDAANRPIAVVHVDPRHHLAADRDPAAPRRDRLQG
ncbi:hypothetical protein STSO111631_12190 [Stackebrandtia soli]